MLVTLKARMEARIPGSLLAVWVQGGEPWSSAFTPAQLKVSFAAVDQFWVMDYSACGMPCAWAGPLPCTALHFPCLSSAVCWLPVTS